MKKLVCKWCGYADLEALVKHHLAKRRTVIICANCHLKEHRKNQGVNYLKKKNGADDSYPETDEAWIKRNEKRRLWFVQ